MSGKTKGNKRQQAQNEDALVLTKDEEKMAKFVRFNCATKKANLHSVKVDFFIASKAVDVLMESKWAKGDEPVLATRQSAVALMRKLMSLEFFNRTVKVYKEQGIESAKPSSQKFDTTNESAVENTPRERKRKGAEQPQPDATPKSSSVAADAEKQKKKFKLELHDDQKFVDANEPYAWIFDPTTTKTIVIGTLLVIGAIGICLFPLWPATLRDGVYYLSLGGAFLLGLLLSLVVVKYILYVVFWILTGGKIKFWLLPNLTEDVGFFESFAPLYKLGDDEKKDGKKVSKPVESKNETKAEENDENDENSPDETNTENVDMEIVDENNDNEDFELLEKEDEVLSQ